MNESDLDMLHQQLLVECGVFLECIDKNKEKGIMLSGLLLHEAAKILYFHPVISFERS